MRVVLNIKEYAVEWLMGLFFIGASVSGNLTTTSTSQSTTLIIMVFLIKAAAIIGGAFVTGFVTHIGTTAGKAAVERFKQWRKSRKAPKK